MTCNFGKFVLFFLVAIPAFAQEVAEAPCAATLLGAEMYSIECVPAAVPNPPQDGILSPAQFESHIFFSEGGADLDQPARDKLLTIVKILQTDIFENSCVQLQGHSSTPGSVLSNYNIALRRAETVSEFLLGKIANAPIVFGVESFGETTPMLNFPSDHNFQRRVAIMVKDCS